MKVLSVQAIRVGNLEVVICTSGFKCPELGCTRVSPRLCLLFTAGVRSVWRSESEDVYTMTHIRQTCTFTAVPGPTHLSISAKFANVGNVSAARPRKLIKRLSSLTDPLPVSGGAHLATCLICQPGMWASRSYTYRVLLVALIFPVMSFQILYSLILLQNIALTR